MMIWNIIMDKNDEMKDDNIAHGCDMKVMSKMMKDIMMQDEMNDAR
jgi:hypothetical protein